MNLTPEQRFPWLTETTVQEFKERLERTGGRLRVTLKDGLEAIATKCRFGVVWFEAGGKTRLANFVLTPVGFVEVGPEFAGRTLGERALEALAIIDRDIARQELDTPRSHFALLSKRQREEQAAQEKAGTTDFQTFDPLTEQVIVSWLREQGDASEEDAVIDTFYDAAGQIENGEHRKG